VRLLPGRPDHGAAALLTQKPKPTDLDIDNAMQRNICRCGTYLRIRQAIHEAAGTTSTKAASSQNNE
jgi:aerobic-type carbon monoxide dehydrogenase small subunit (CoxS/CutS family)